MSGGPQARHELRSSLRASEAIAEAVAIHPGAADRPAVTTQVCASVVDDLRRHRDFALLGADAAGHADSLATVAAEVRELTTPTRTDD